MRTVRVTTQKLLDQAYQRRAFQGKHLVIIGGHTYSASSGKAAHALFKKLIKKHPGEKPIVTYIPKADTLILGFYG